MAVDGIGTLGLFFDFAFGLFSGGTDMNHEIDLTIPAFLDRKNPICIALLKE